MSSQNKIKDTNMVIIDGVNYTMVDTVEKSTRVVSKSLIVKDIYERWTNESMVPDGFLQRMEGQWAKKQNSRLIYAMLESRPIGTIIIATGRTYDNDYTVYSILDGLQRTTAIVNFINNKFKLDKKENPIVCRLRNEEGNIVEKTYEIAGKNFKSLPKVLQNKFLDYSVRIDSYEGFSDEELDDVMFCVNNGKSPTTYQKMRFALGTDNMRLIQPICESLTWEEVTGCKTKNDSVLCSVLRGLMLYTNCVNGGLSANGINKFIEGFDSNVSANMLKKFTDVVGAFDDIKSKMTREEREFLDSCNTPHFVANFDVFNSLENKNGKNYLDFFRVFTKSNEWDKFTDYKAKKIDDESNITEKGEKSGSGGTQYSAESVKERQYIIDNSLYDFIARSVV